MKPSLGRSENRCQPTAEEKTALAFSVVEEAGLREGQGGAKRRGQGEVAGEAWRLGGRSPNS